MDNIAVVGGGFTGIVAAKALDARNVTIFEAAKGLGGILRDISCGEGQYLSGCQYLSSDGSWTKYFKEYEADLLYEFNHTYGSYTDIFGEISVSDKVAMPVFDGFVDVDSADLAGVKSLKDRLYLYPPQIESPMSDWFTHIGVDVARVHHSAAMGFQASRIYPRKVEALTYSIKCAEPGKDYLYGLPRETLGIPHISAKLPQRGYNHLCDQVQHELGASLQLESTVRLARSGKKISLSAQGLEHVPDLIVWTVNPVPLFRELLSYKLDSLRHTADILVGPVLNPVERPFYIQVFSKYSRIMRLFFYNIDGRGAYTIEKAHDKESDSDVLRSAQLIAEKFCEYQLGRPSARRKNFRYFAFSVNDADVLNQFESASNFDNLITPSFLSYGRDERVDSVLASLTEQKIL